MSILITGASSGIGAAIAKEYAKKGLNLVLCARRPDRLQQVSNECKSLNSGTRVIEAICDVTKREDLDAAVNLAIKQFGKIDVVIANAGFGVGGAVEKLSVENFRRQFETNVFGVLNTVYATLSALKASQGRLAILGSVYSYISEGKRAPYCMSKFAVRALSESLYFELQKYGISVTLICPGVVESEIRKVDNDGVFRPDAKERAPAWLIVNSGTAARQMVKAIERRKREVIVTNHGKLAVFLQRHFPEVLAWLLSQVYSRINPARH